MKTIIFDFDGTIADSFPYTQEIVNELAPKYGYEPMTADEIESLRSLPFSEIIKKYHIGPITLLRMTLDAHKANGQRIEKTQLFPGMIEMLTELANEGYSLAIMSSNAKKNIAEFLKINNIELFSSIDTSISLFGKGKKLVTVMKKHGIAPAEAIYIGDEVRDITAAHEAGIGVVSVDWGYNTREVLLENNASVASNPAELRSYIMKSFK
jgi:phosphoglycolate phosphatase